MSSFFLGADEPKTGSSILPRRGGTDANAPESLRKAILRDFGMLAFLGPQLAGNPGKCSKRNKYRQVVRNRSISKEMG